MGVLEHLPWELGLLLCHMVGSDLTVHWEPAYRPHCPACSEGGFLPDSEALSPAAPTQWGPCFSSLNQYYPRLSDSPGKDVGLMQGAGIFLAIKVFCSLHSCGSLAQEFPAPAHVLSL